MVMVMMMFDTIMKKYPLKMPFGNASDESDYKTGSGTVQSVIVITGRTAEKAKLKPKKPPLYKVLLLNDDYTPMEFVVVLLIRLFSMNQEQAEQIMLHVHNKGVGVCGVFPKEIAETKVHKVIDFASEHQHPLQCVMEKN